MRMWMIDPRILCRKHLLGEHVETHMFAGTLNAGKDMSGYVRNNLLEVLSLRERHDALAAEMTRRGMKHKSPLRPYTCRQMTPKQRAYKVDQHASLEDLLGRCPQCRKRAE